MEVSGQLQASAALPPYPLDKGWMGPRFGLGHCEEEKNLALSGLIPRSARIFPSPQLSSPSLYRLHDLTLHVTQHIQN
jgi:hypothetical protein